MKLRNAFNQDMAYRGNSSIFCSTGGFRISYHYHIYSFEIVWVKKGSGIRYVGDHEEPFYENDLVLLAPFLPHVWKINRNESEEPVCSRVIHFKENLWHQFFSEIPELKKIKALLHESKRGIKFTNLGDIQLIYMLIERMQQAKTVKKITYLIEILAKMADTSHRVKLASMHYSAGDFGDMGQDEWSKIYTYIERNYREPDLVTLDEVWKLSTVHGKSQFFKYFKKRTRKTFSEYVNDRRLDYAKFNLMETDKNITRIGKEAGFNSQSQFFTLFRKKVGTTPLKYRQYKQERLK